MYAVNDNEITVVQDIRLQDPLSLSGNRSEKRYKNASQRKEEGGEALRTL